MSHLYKEIMGESGIDRIDQFHAKLQKWRPYVSANNPDYLVAKAEPDTPRVTVVPYVPPVPPVPQTPAEWVKQVRGRLAMLPPYYVSQATINLYQSFDAAQKEAYRAEFEVGAEDRWTILRDFILDCRTITSEAPADWATWDAAHPTETQADLLATLDTINGWAN